jgi:Holliday junction resolvase
MPASNRTLNELPDGIAIQNQVLFMIAVKIHRIGLQTEYPLTNLMIPKIFGYNVGSSFIKADI